MDEKDNPERSSIERRTYLKVTGSSVAFLGGLSGTADVASAKESGYGLSGFGTVDFGVATDSSSGINSGSGSAYTASDEAEFSVDEYASSGRTYSTEDSIDNTSDDTLYQTERYGTNFTYDIPVSGDAYDVTLHFAEIYLKSAGKRVFDVTVEGTTPNNLTDLDIYAEAGHDTALVKTVSDVNPTDGSVTIDFTASKDNAKISAIELTPIESDQLPWEETFDEVADGTTSDENVTAWMTDTSNASPTTFSVQNGEFRAVGDTNGEAVWRSETIDIGGADSVDIAVDIRAEGDLENSGSNKDTLTVEYVLDGRKTNLTTRHADISNSFETVQATGLSGDTLEIHIRATVSADTELYAWDNVTVQAASGNIIPTADAGSDQTVVDDDGDGLESITLDGSGSTDSDGSITSYAWTKDGNSLASGEFVDIELGVGTHDITLTVTDDQGATDRDAMTVTVSGQSDGLNTGGSAYTAGDGTEFSADEYASGGRTYSTEDSIDNTSDDTLYQTERYGTNFTYDIPVSGDAYDVALHFAEIYQKSAGKRVFDVTVEGTTPNNLTDLDIYAEAGHDTALVKTVSDVNPTDGSVTIDFTASKDNAKISAIELTPVKDKSSDTEVTKEHHTKVLTFDGPSTDVQSSDPHPFLDYRLDIIFSGPSGQTYTVPGFYAGDGNGGSSGNKWRAKFAPDEAGEWSYEASFWKGDRIAVSNSPATDGTRTSFDGASGTFSVDATDKTKPDLRARGTIANRGDHYLTDENGDVFVQCGPNIPENFLGYKHFSNMPEASKEYNSHESDWKSGDPKINHDKGIVGALNFIAERGANSIYFLPMNLGGDGEDTYPFPAPDQKTRYDPQKLREWETVFSHAESQGILLHFVLSEHETSNQTFFDNGGLGPERKLFFRELIARFSHHAGVVWNVGEEAENQFNDADREAMAAELSALEPYGHPITVHNWSETEDEFDNFLGKDTLDFAALQNVSGFYSDIPTGINDWRTRSADSGHPWTVALTEPQKIENNDDVSVGKPYGRREKMWPAFMGGAASFEWYIQNDGAGHSLDQDIEDFNRIEGPLRWSGIARDILENKTPAPLLGMDYGGTVSGTKGHYLEPNDGNGYWIVALPEGGSGSIDTEGKGDGSLSVTWYDPTTGDELGTYDASDGQFADPPINGDVVGIIS